MGKLNRLFRIPPGVARSLMLLGLLWMLLGWAFNVGVWVIGIAGAVLYGLLYARRVVTVTLSPFSKERGIVLWAHYRKPEPTQRPQVVWGEAQARDESPSGPGG